MSQWLEWVADCQARDEACVLVTLAAIQGSSPREPGAKMIVTADGSRGTLGGGTVELLAQERARELLKAGVDEAQPQLEEFVLNDSLDQACGGRMTLLFEPLLPTPLKIAIFGAGHVGQALVKVLADVPCRIDWIDSRPEMFPQRVPGNVHAQVLAQPWEAVAKLPPNAFVLAMTHSHDTDLEIVDAALRAMPDAFIGTIGSKTKRGRFRHRLAERGLSEADIDRLVIPIGLPGVGGKRPAEIAVAVAAQILQEHYAGAG